MSDVDALKLRRGNLKRSLTVFNNFLTNADPTRDYNEVYGRFTSKIEKLLDEFENIHIEILTIEKVQDIEDPENEHNKYRDEFEESFYRVARKARDFIYNNPQPASQIVTNDATNGDNAHTNQSVHTENTQYFANIRMPKIDLPTFDGSYDTWLSFRDSFKSLVHDKTHITPIEKLHYLNSCLKGEAATTIQSLDLSEASYQVAWDLLTERYNNKKLIVHKHLKALLEHPTMTQETSIDIRRLLDNINSNTRALNSLGVCTKTWDSIIIHCMTSKLTTLTHQKWEKSVPSTELPSLKEFLDFLKTRCQILEATTLQTTEKPHNRTSHKNTTHNKRYALTTTTQQTEHCNLCQGTHKIFRCEEFMKLTTSERYNAVKRLKLCFNCLRKGHSIDACRCGPCKICNKKHNSLLHIENKSSSNTTTSSLNIQTQTSSNENNSISNSQPTIYTHSIQSSHQHSQILLATAQIDFLDKNNKKQTARVLLDSGAQANFITEKFASALQLTQMKTNIPVSGLNQLETSIQASVKTKIISRVNNYEADITCLIVPNITHPLPSQQLNTEVLEIPKNIQLADPLFHKTREIDALLGADIFYNILCVGQIRVKNQSAVWQKTRFGWVIAGNIINHISQSNTISCHLALNTLDTQLAKFWEIEETPAVKFLSQEQSWVEEHFIQNVTRSDDGRLVVKLPFNEKINSLGESYTTALKRFYALERKLEKSTDLKNQYTEFMQEYERLGHMSEIDFSQNNDQEFFLPHHAVIKESSTTTKLRVVFDGSAKTSTGISLNDTLRVGPTIQDDVLSILIRFRTHEYVLVADIEKMYRQILLNKEDRRYQKIIWRENTTDQLKIYQLNTITYGTSSVPFLAIRGLQKLAEDEKQNFPIASEIIKRDFYVDDLLTGSNTYSNTLQLRNQIDQLLRSGGFKLRQWSSNEPKLVSSLPSELTNHELFSNPSKTVKTLGIQWNPFHDKLCFSIPQNEKVQTKITKRSILSDITQLFDPIGLLGPIIIKAKIIMQHLWKEELNWDESVSSSIQTEWINFKNQLPLLNEIYFQRKIIISNPRSIELHGFCDASEAAYGACLFIRSVNKDNESLIRLLCSKTRVAPLKSQSLANLELCAALLLSRLYKAASSAIPINFNAIHFWSDSTITLNWINTQPYILKTFVANRVSEIRTTTDPLQWRHVPGKLNPADALSRGQTINEFINNEEWKNGPNWLSKSKKEWPQSPIEKIPLLEVRKIRALKVTLNDVSFLNKFSSISKLVRVIAYCFRFARNCLSKTKNTDILNTHELNMAHNSIIKLTQYLEFSREIDHLSNGEEINRKSALKTLNPFSDENKIVRVGGRLSNSDLPYDQKHPILLPKNNHITELIIRKQHEQTLHAGVQNTLYQIRTRYWPIDGRNSTKKIINSCVKCFRFKNTEHRHIMGNLPKNRLIPARPFLNAGVDFCGPFFIKEKKHRNRNKIKVYVAVFICFSTKAIHLELVSDLSTHAFLNTLKRFFARRGKSENIYSDNGTNFVGANNEIKRLYAFINSHEENNEIRDQLASKGINWHFIPPRSPHFGGLWESAVKLFKKHFLRTVGNTLLTFEELYTHVAEVEAILNSRPLTPLSSDPNDLIALTPGHFLINDSLIGLPEFKDFSNVSPNRLTNYEHLQQLKQHFWERWHKEYLNELNIRKKWIQRGENVIEIGTYISSPKRR